MYERDTLEPNSRSFFSSVLSVVKTRRADLLIEMKANMPENPQDRAAFTYNAAADFYDASPLSFWDYFGRRTIELVSLPIGSRVLDVCCGTGASALSAAEAVGPTGNVIGIDLAKQLLELARAKAIQQRLGNVEFEVGD